MENNQSLIDKKKEILVLRQKIYTLEQKCLKLRKQEEKLRTVGGGVRLKNVKHIKTCSRANCYRITQPQKININKYKSLCEVCLIYERDRRNPQINTQ